MNNLKQLVDNLDKESERLEKLNSLFFKIRYYCLMVSLHPENEEYKRLLNINNELYFKQTNVSIL